MSHSLGELSLSSVIDSLPDVSAVEKSSKVSASREYLEAKKRQRIEMDGLNHAPHLKQPETLSHYHSQIAASSVEAPRKHGKKGKQLKKVERGINYSSKQTKKSLQQNRKRDIVKKAKSR